MTDKIRVVNDTDFPLCVTIEWVNIKSYYNVLHPGHYIDFSSGDYVTYNYNLNVVMNPTADQMVSGTDWVWKHAAGTSAVLIASGTAGAGALAAVPAGAFSAGAVALAGSPWIGVSLTALAYGISAGTLAMTKEVYEAWAKTCHATEPNCQFTGEQYKVTGGKITQDADGTITSVSDMVINFAGKV